MKSTAGRKTKYSPAIVKRICGFISDGLFLKDAAAAAGCSETSLRVWRMQYPEFAEAVEQARQVALAKVLARIKEIGMAKDGDFRALAEWARLSYPHLRYGNSQQLNVAIQNNNSLEVSDSQRAELIKMRNDALAKNNNAPEPKQLAAGDARAIALETERSLQEERSAERLAEAEPERLREHAPRTERADWRDERSRPFRDWEEIGSEDGLG